MDKIKDELKVKNSYSNKEDRVSFSIQAVNCNIEEDSNCESAENIKDFFESLYFTTYILEEQV